MKVCTTCSESIFKYRVLPTCPESKQKYGVLATFPESMYNTEDSLHVQRVHINKEYS